MLHIKLTVHTQFVSLLKLINTTGNINKITNAPAQQFLLQNLLYLATEIFFHTNECFNQMYDIQFKLNELIFKQFSSDIPENVEY